MKKFELTMMCTSCKWKISQELKKKGYSNFDIDMDSSILTFQDEIESHIIIRTINNIGYKIEEIPVNEDFSEEDLALLEDAIRKGY